MRTHDITNVLPPNKVKRIKIRTLFLLSAAILFVLSFAVVLVSVRTAAVTNGLAEQGTLAEQVIIAAFEQNNFALEYVDRHEERPKQQWYLQNARMLQMLGEPALHEEPSRSALPQLLDNMQSLKSTFDEMVAKTEAGSTNVVAKEQLAGDLLVRSRSIIVFADAMAQRAFEARSEARARTDRVVLELLALLVGATLLIGIILYRRIIGSLGMLQKGVRIVGRGNLEYQVGNGADCEIGLLSQSFDDMTQKLRHSYATLEDRVKERTRELDALNRKNATLLQSIGEGVIAIDRRWDIILLNRAAEQMTGWSSADAVGMPFRDVVKFVREKDRTENVAFIEEVMLHGATRNMDADTLLIDKTGKALPVADSASPVFDQLSGKVSGAIIVFRDATAERELHAKSEQLAKFKDDFMFRTIHDLRSPANGIRMALDMHAEEEERRHVPDELRQGLSMIRDASSRMAKLIEDLLEIARGEKAEVLLRSEPLRIEEVIDALALQLAPDAKAKKLKIEVVKAEGLPEVYGDSDALKEVFDNLINNAIKYNKPKGRVSVRIEPDGDMVQVTVLDTGIGMTPADLSSLFKPYFRAGGNDIPGTGLGLYIVKKLVEKMGGTIEAVSTVGEGSRFLVRLPTKAAA